jgi:hypothetical protein
MKKYNNFNIIILIFFFFYFFYILNFYTLFTFENYEDIGLYSDDELYLADQLLSTVKYNKIIFLNADAAQYGAEFYYFRYLYSFINFFFHLSNKDIVYFAIFVHFLLGFCAFFLLQKLLLDLNIDKFLVYFIFFLIFTSNEKFIFSLSSLKPDSNLCLFFIILSLCCLINYKKKYFYLASIAFASLAFVIKLWGLFLLLPIIYYYKLKKFNIQIFFSKKKLYLLIAVSKLILLCLITYNLKFLTSYYLIDYKILIISFFFTISVLSSTFILSIYLLNKFLSHLSISTILISSYFFIFFSLIFSLPISIDSDVFMRSIKFFAYDSIHYTYQSKETFINVPVNTFKDLIKYFQYDNYLTIPLFLLSIFIFIKNKKKNTINFILFLFCFQIFIFYLIYGRINTGYYIMYFCIWSIIIIQLDQIKKINKNIFNILVTIIFIFVLFKNFNLFKKEYNIFNYPIVSYQKEVKEIKSEILKMIGKTKKIHIIVCQSKLNLDFLKEKNYQITSLKRPDCKLELIEHFFLKDFVNYAIILDFQIDDLESKLKLNNKLKMSQIYFNSLINFKIEKRKIYLLKNS